MFFAQLRDHLDAAHNLLTAKLRESIFFFNTRDSRLLETPVIILDIERHPRLAKIDGAAGKPSLNKVILISTPDDHPETYGFGLNTSKIRGILC